MKGWFILTVRLFRTFLEYNPSISHPCCFHISLMTSNWYIIWFMIIYIYIYLHEVSAGKRWQGSYYPLQRMCEWDPLLWTGSYKNPLSIEINLPLVWTQQLENFGFHSVCGVLNFWDVQNHNITDEVALHPETNSSALKIIRWKMKCPFGSRFGSETPQNILKKAAFTHLRRLLF